MSSRRLGIAAVALGTVLFGGAIAARQVVNPWWANTAAAVVLVGLSWAVLRGRLAALFALRARGLLAAVGLGVAMVVATHVGFQIASGIFPALEQVVAALYRDVNQTTPGPIVSALLTALIVVAEELVWRGVVIELSRLSRWATAALAVVLYALPQVIGGAWILVAVAIAVGAVFTAQRLVTGRLVEPIITHAIWSTSVFIAVPLV